jgi:NADPH:quinone reductase-like Zn-dependent oxidoreductase
MAVMSLPELPTSQQAVVQSNDAGNFEISAGRPIPTPLPTEVLVKVAAVALNHCDWKMPSRVPCPGAVNGADYSGTVVRMGEVAAQTSGLMVGDRVAGAQMASNHRRPWAGAYAEYIREEADCCWKVPDNLSWEEAAAVGCAASLTSAMGVWYSLKLTGTPESPTSDPKYVLVYGGATASGTYAIQILKL